MKRNLEQSCLINLIETRMLFCCISILKRKYDSWKEHSRATGNRKQSTCNLEENFFYKLVLIGYTPAEHTSIDD
jgi:hypothetical protein